MSDLTSSHVVCIQIRGQSIARNSNWTKATDAPWNVRVWWAAISGLANASHVDRWRGLEFNLPVRRRFGTHRCGRDIFHEKELEGSSEIAEGIGRLGYRASLSR
jgi:hypothetical protein